MVTFGSTYPGDRRIKEQGLLGGSTHSNNSPMAKQLGFDTHLTELLNYCPADFSIYCMLADRPPLHTESTDIQYVPNMFLGPNSLLTKFKGSLLEENFTCKMTICISATHPVLP